MRLDKIIKNVITILLLVTLFFVSLFVFTFIVGNLLNFITLGVLDVGELQFLALLVYLYLLIKLLSKLSRVN